MLRVCVLTNSSQSWHKAFYRLFKLSKTINVFLTAFSRWGIANLAKPVCSFCNFWLWWLLQPISVWKQAKVCKVGNSALYSLLAGAIPCFTTRDSMPNAAFVYNQQICYKSYFLLVVKLKCWNPSTILFNFSNFIYYITKQM